MFSSPGLFPHVLNYEEVHLNSSYPAMVCSCTLLDALHNKMSEKYGQKFKNMPYQNTFHSISTESQMVPLGFSYFCHKPLAAPLAVVQFGSDLISILLPTSTNGQLSM